ncbi:hypothetical protein ACSOQV_000382 [Yersinia enterocolitica]
MPVNSNGAKNLSRQQREGLAERESQDGRIYTIFGPRRQHQAGGYCHKWNSGLLCVCTLDNSSEREQPTRMQLEE